MIRKLPPLCCLALALAGLLGTAAHAGWPYGGWNYGPYRSFINGRPPFYAEFPPVYYSAPQARPYGLYPYAYYAEPTRPAPAPTRKPAPQPEIVVNPYVQRQPAGDSALVQQPRPLRIVNPYVSQPAAPEAAAAQAAE